MPNKDVRAAAAARKGKFSTAGRRNVVYRDTNGKSRNARVLDQGSASGLKLALTSNSNVVIDNVPQCTTVKGTACYITKH